MTIDTGDLRGQYIGGAWRDSDDTDQVTVLNPAHESVLASLPTAGHRDIDDAVTAARSALTAWSETPVTRRIEAVRAIADGIESRADDFTQLIVSELGMPVKLARRLQVDLAATDFRTTAVAAEAHEFTWEAGNSRITEEPIGVVAAITPWNYPLHQIAAKLSAALAAGCTVVLKPSEITPLNALLLARVIDDVGLPPGVVNIVIGGASVGRTLVEHPGIDMISFTGSPRTGSAIAAIAGRDLKPVALELGGKGASVVLDDLDEAGLVTAVRRTVSSCYLNSGQTCSALTRLVVPSRLLAAAESAAREAAAKFGCGDPADPATRLGPLVSSAQRDRVWEYIADGLAAGGRLVSGGPGAPENVSRGYFVRPTVFSDIKPDVRVAQEEIFGPVLVIIESGSAEESIDIANGTPYGLTAAVWSATNERAQAVAAKLRAGQVDINGAAYNPAAPFGGFGRSGFGREYGTAGIREFLTTRSVQR